MIMYAGLLTRASGVRVPHGPPAETQLRCRFEPPDWVLTQARFPVMCAYKR